MNQNNNNDLYHEDNSFNNQGIDMPKDEPTTGESLSNMANSGMNFAKGINNIKNNPALGLKKPKENNNESDKKDGNNKNNQNNNDPAKGQKDKKDDKNQMPGAKKNDDSKKPNAKNDSNNKNKSGNNNIGNKNKPNGMFSRFNPMNKNKPGKSGNSKKTPGTTAPNLNQMAKKGLRTAWTAAPIQVKLIVIGVAIVPILIIGFIALLSIFGATVAATTAAMCGVDSFGSSYNGADYTGSADRKEFLCKMQNPLGKKTNYVITGVAGENRGYAHAGIDLAISKGTPIYAAQSGTVVSVHDGCTVENQRYNPCGGGYGNNVKIKHGDAFYTLYAHMVNGSVKVKKGDKVGKGQLIGQVGSTGRSTGPHLHLELRTSSDNVIYDHNQYFKNIESFKANCGSMWEGDPTGDSANAENDTTDYVSSGGLSSSECCGSGSSSSEPVEGLPKAITQEFVDAAISTQTKYKVPASLTLAQLILESGAHSNSLSELAVKCKNLFGVKGNGPAGSCRYQTSEQTSSGHSYDIYASFAKYNNYQESFDERGKLLTGSYYQRCVKEAKTGDEWARAVKECGYAHK